MAEEKNKTGTLFLVGTPIGNMGDITYRAVQTLNDADLIACEDTRHTAPLLSKYGIKKPLVSYHKFNERESAEKLIEQLKSGKNIALVTDAGMPTISDPGSIVARQAQNEGVKVTVVPGPSAVVSALTLAGTGERGFVFLGFLPPKNKERETLLMPFKDSALPLVFYCSPHDINSDISYLYNILGEREVIAVKEITKIFEGVQKGKLSDFAIEEPRGEFVLIVQGFTGSCPLNRLPIPEHVAHYMKSGLTKKEAIKRAAADRGVDKNTVYSQTLDL